MKNVIFFVIITLISFFIGILVGCHRRSDARGVDGPPDTVVVSGSVPSHVPPVPEVYFLPIKIAVDTQAVINDYYSQKVYKDTIINLPQLTVSVTDTVTENRLLDRVINYTYKPEIVTRAPKYQLAVSAMAGYRSLPAFLELQKEKVAVMVGYDFYNKSPMLGFKYRFAAWN